MATRIRPAPSLYMVIDYTVVEETKVVKLVPHNEAQAWGKILAAEGRKVMAPPLLGRGFSKLDKLPLQYLYWNTCQVAPPEDYGVLVKTCLAAIAELDQDPTPLAELEARVAYLYPDGELAAPRQEKVAKAPGDPSLRPKATSTTGLVWLLADEVLARETAVPLDWKAIRAAVMVCCEAEGINAGTSGVQYSKWKASKMAGPAIANATA